MQSEHSGVHTLHPGGASPAPEHTHEHILTNSIGADQEMSRLKKNVGTFIDPDYYPNDRTIQWSEEQLGRRVTADDVMSFVDYWLTRGDEKAMKKDWDATFRNHIRYLNKVTANQPAITRSGGNANVKPAATISEWAERELSKLYNEG